MIGFILAFALSLYIFSRDGKSNRLYIKSLFSRLLTSFIISLTFGYAAVWFIMFLHGRGIDIKYPF